ncbi:ABC transporter ATP-binding protein [Martelella alba]|uniref:Spermidine/putrescine import ATP-binding protein PotA n=1 Tax=Martelella alba TaxID=2590451 RepID=A0A506U6I9_9HYPH|nr:ABC transporter ATP-binding protein [Martelella alba]TPW29118.1 ABC transporter ATP-binding protein [Martelella alba]
MQPIVHFSNVTKSYGSGAPAVDALDLAIEKGKFVTLLGPSGCGKSTTLRMLGGFETPTSGAITLSGNDVTYLPPHKRNVNIVFQDYALFPHLTVARNIAFGLELKGMSSAGIKKRVDELLALVRLEDYADRMPSALSGGQRQRVALVRALAPDPDVLLLDEPLSALDAKLRHQMQIELKSIQEQTGKTFLFVTHDQEEAVTMSDVIVVMNSGRIEQMGDPQTLYARPKNRFVATFIGESNFLDATMVSAEDGIATLNWGGLEIHACLTGPAPEAGRTVTVSLRPEAIFAVKQQLNRRNVLPGEIVGEIFKGSHSLLTVRLPDGRELTVDLDPVALGQIDSSSVWIGWRENDAVVLAD